ncbi:MAG: hypothetical protein ABI906_07075 [Pseudomonadota bacterium]
MPNLQNSRHGAFAAARARGARLEDAYEDAGFVPDKSHACRLANRPEVAERVSELRREREGVDDAAPEAIIAALVRLAKDSEAAKTPAGMKEARLNLLEAHRLRIEQTATRRMDRGSQGVGYA